MEDSAKNVVY